MKAYTDTLTGCTPLRHAIAAATTQAWQAFRDTLTKAQNDHIEFVAERASVSYKADELTLRRYSNNASRIEVVVVATGDILGISELFWVQDECYVNNWSVYGTRPQEDDNVTG